MTKRTRLFLSVAAGILVAGLGTGLLASYVGLQNLTLIGSDGPAELAYIPADARLLAFANVRDVMDSEVRRKLSSLHAGDNAGANRFKEQTGIDLETDVDYVVATLSGTSGDPDPTKGEPPLVLARGRFDQVRIEGFIREQGAVAEDYKASRLLVHETLAVAFVEPGLAVIGPPDAVRQAIDTKASGADVRGNSELMRIVRDVEDGDGWVVARFDAFAKSRLPADVVKQLPAISWFSAKGMVDTGLQGQLRVEARDEESAQNLRQVIQGFVALARLQAGQQAQLAELLNSLQLEGVGKTVSVSFTIPSELIDVLGAMRAQRPRPPRPAPVAPPAPPAL